MRPNPPEKHFWSHLLKKSLVENFILCAVCPIIWLCNRRDLHSKVNHLHDWALILSCMILKNGAHTTCFQSMFGHFSTIRLKRLRIIYQHENYIYMFLILFIWWSSFKSRFAEKHCWILSTLLKERFTLLSSQPAITCLKLPVKTIEQGMKYVQS